MTKAYLAGPINYLSFDAAQEWRVKAIRYLQTYHITGVSPLRGKEILRRQDVIHNSYEDRAITSARGITTRDRFDVMTCDVMLANFLGATERPSCGTPVEFGWADAFRKPVIMVMEPSGNAYDHPMMDSIAGYRVTTLEEGLHLVVKILT